MIIVVQPGKVGVVKPGESCTLTTNGLTNTSAFVGHLYRIKNRERLCTFLMHRGEETDYQFFAAAEVALKDYLPLKEKWVRPLAFLVGPDPHTIDPRQSQDAAQNAAVGIHRRSDMALVVALSFLFRNLTVIELRAMRAYGPRIDANTNLCSATVYKSGHTFMNNIHGLVQCTSTEKMNPEDIF